jgi:hypothetical protein
LAQVFLQGFRIVGKLPGHVTVHYNYLTTKGFQQGWHRDRASRIDGIHHNFVAFFRYRSHIHQGQGQYFVNMFLNITVILAVRTQLIHSGILDVFFLHQRQNLCAVIGTDELAMAVQQFQGVPFSRVVAGRQDNSARSLLHHDSHFYRGRSAQAQINHV